MTTHTTPTSTRERCSAPGRHRKPGRAVPGRGVVTLGIATGVLGTVVAAAPASAAEQPALGHTLELSAMESGLLDAAVTAEYIREGSHRIELDAHEEQQSAWASARARQAMADAEAQAARAKAERAEAEKAEAERAEAERAFRAKARNALGKGEGAAATSPRSGGLSAVAAFARSKIGSAYVYGASSGSAFDCSGLVQAAYRAAGVAVPRTSQAQSGAYAEVRGELRPGDILYWGAKGAATHVAVYVGGGEFVGAQNPREGVVLRDLAGSKYSGAVRPG